MIKDKIFHEFVNLMNTRVPTSSQPLNSEQRKEIASLLKPGDILLETNDAYPGWQAIEKLAFQSDWTHAALYEGNGKVIDAVTGEKVAEVPVDDFLQAYHIAALRPEYKSEADVKAALDYSKSHVGDPYDEDYFDLEENHSYTGVKLIYYALQHMPNPIHVSLLKTFETIPVLRGFGKPIISPESFRRTPETSHEVFSTKSRFWKNILSHWPLSFGTLALGTLGFAFGPVAGIAGAVAGTVLMNKVGNILQKGQP